MKPSKIIILALATTALTACSSDDSETTPQSQQKRQISISVTENPFINPNDASVKGITTRSAVITTPTLDQFYMNWTYSFDSSHYKGNKTATKKENETGKWISDEYWPGLDTSEDITVNWYAYTDGEFDLSDDSQNRPSLDFTVAEEPVSQKDLLVSKTSDTYANCKGNLFFAFDHACAALRFYVKKAKNMSDYSITVSDACLCNVVKEGEFYFDDNSWILRTEKGVQNHPLYRDKGKTTLSLDDATYQPLDPYEDPYLFLIPQTLTSWDASSNTGCYIKVTCQIMADSHLVHNGDVYIPFSGILAKGYQYDVNINIGKNSLYKSDGTKIIND